MTKYLIEKEVEAKTLAEAIKKQNKGRILRITREQEKKSKEELVSAIGFEMPEPTVGDDK